MERAEVLLSHLVPTPVKGKTPKQHSSPASEPVSKMSGPAVVATCTGGVNIAVIKYWGKRDEKRILPINSSISATLSQADLATTTSIIASPSIKSDRLWLNGKYVIFLGLICCLFPHLISQGKSRRKAVG
jgi:hypothetical protein